VESHPDSPNFERVLGILRRRGLWILLCCILAAVAAFGLSKHQAKKYTATASLAFKSDQLAQQIAGLSTNFLSVQSEQDSDVRLVQVGDMAARTASRLRHGLTQQKVDESLSIAQQGETNTLGESSIVDVSASLASPALAAQIANTYAEQFVAEQQASNHRYFTSALADVNRQLAELPPKQRLTAAGVALQNRAQELTLLSDLQYGGVQLAQRATVPTAPSSPKTSRNTLIGAVLGLLVGLGLALLLERLDRRIREPQELEAIYESPLLGIVPESPSLARSTRDTQSAGPTPSPVEMEAFNLIVAHLRSFNADREIRAVLITSPAPGDGVTTISLHMAEAAAITGARTLLLELDLRAPTLTHHVRIKSRPGLGDVLTNSASLEDAIQTVKLRATADDGPKVPTFDILASGATQLPYPGELTKDRTMQTALERMISIYDLVIIDAPSLIAVSDAFPALRKVDGVIVVGQIGHDRRDIAEQLKQVLNRSSVPLLGVVANRSTAGGPHPYPHSGVEGGGTPFAPVPSHDPVASDVETRSLART
jgi:capsular exopolysaccharide synthesis family protein